MQQPRNPVYPTMIRGRAGDLRQARRLEVFTVTWNLLEAAVGILAGLAAGSIALIGFALDSIVESSSGLILLWRINAETSGRRPAEEAERKAIRGAALAFLALAVYVGVRSGYDLAAGSRPDPSPTGIGLAIVSLIVMPLLARRKRAAARRIDSRALQADAKQTSLCVSLSAFLLAGLAANAIAGWWWADPIAGLFLASVAAKEGIELWRTKDLCCH